MGSGYTNLPLSAAPTWRAAVTNVGDLPTSNNKLGDTRMVTSTHTPYMWDGAAWQSAGGGSTTDSFTIWQPDHGTSPTASSSTDTMDVTSADASVTITGNSSTKTLNFQLSSSLQTSISNAAPKASPTFTGTVTLPTTTVVGNYVMAPTEYNAGSSGTSLSINFANGSSQLITMSGNCTFAFSNGQSGGSYVLRIAQASFTMAWPGTVTWLNANNTAPVQGGSGKTLLVNLYYDGSTYWGSYVGNY